MCCVGLSKTYLYLLNTLTALAGLGVVGVAIWQLTTFSAIDSVLSKDSLWLVLATGAAVFFLSLLGCTAARGQHKCALFVYCVLVLAVAAAQLGGGAVVANYAGQLNYDNKNLDNLDAKVREFVECSYEWCCTDQGPSSCTSDVWNSDGFCKVLPDELHNKNSPECKDESKFDETILDFLHDHSRTLATTAIVLGSVQVLALLCATCLICAPRKKSLEELEAERRLNEHQNAPQAGQLVYGSQPPAYAV